MTLVRDDGSIGEGQPAALAPANHGLDGVAEEATCRSGIAQFAGPLLVFPRDLERFLKQLGKRNGHSRETISTHASSVPPRRRYMMSGNVFRAATIIMN